MNVSSWWCWLLYCHLNLGDVFQVDILCNEEILGKDHTLKFVFVTRWRTKVSTPHTHTHAVDFLCHIMEDLAKWAHPSSVQMLAFVR